MIPKKTQERINKQLEDRSSEKNAYDIYIDNILFGETHQSSPAFEIEVTDAMENWSKKIFINNKTLTVLFSNGEHVCVKCSDEDEYSVFVGFCVAITKYLFGTNAKDIRKMILDKVDPKKKEEVAENLKQGTNTIRNLINSECIKNKYQSITIDCADGKIIIEGKEPREPDPEPLESFNTWSVVNQLDEMLSNVMKEIIKEIKNEEE